MNKKPLIAHTIQAALKSKLNRVIVATDSPKIRNIALKYGAECPFIRPKNISKDKSHAFEIYKYALEWLKKNEKNYNPDALCTLLCTTPFRDTSTINKCVDKLKTRKYDWVFQLMSLNIILTELWLLKINQFSHYLILKIKNCGATDKNYLYFIDLMEV